MKDFDASQYERRWYTKGEFYLIKGFDFQKDIPDRKGKQKNTFPGIRSLLAYLTEKGLQIYITNEELDKDYEMVGDGKFLVDITKFVQYCNIMSSKASPKLAQGFFTHDIDVKNAKFTEEQKMEIASNLSNNILVSAITAKPIGDNIEILQEVIDKLTIIEKRKLSIEPNLENISTESIVNEAHKRKSKDKEKYINSLCSSLSDDDFDEIVQQNLCGKDFVNIAYRKAKLEIFKTHLENNDWIESQWQAFFEENPWIFGYGLHYRFMKIFDREMTVANGGSSNQDKPKVDFLGEYSDFTVLVELKLPESLLFVESSKFKGKEKETGKNRAGSWKLSDEFIWAYSQVLEQKVEWMVQGQTNNNFSNDGKRQVKARTKDPKCILVFGNKDKQITSIESISDKQIKEDTFELFRRDSRNIEIITYDELFERAKFICSNDEKVIPKKLKKKTK